MRVKVESLRLVASYGKFRQQRVPFRVLIRVLRPDTEKVIKVGRNCPPFLRWLYVKSLKLVSSGLLGLVWGVDRL